MQSFIILLLICSIVMSALGLCYMALTPLLAKRYSPKGRYYAWLAIVVGLIIPFRPQFNNSVVSVTSTETTMPNIQIGNNTPLLTQPNVNLPTDLTSNPFSWWQIVAIAWVIGAIAFLAYHIAKHYRFVKITRRWSTAIADQETLDFLQNLKDELGISTHISLNRCECVGTPMLLGFFHPQILLPNHNFQTDELYFVLKHELIHHKRKDLGYKYLVLLANAVHWFNPVVHLMAKAIANLCEISCDVEVLRQENMETRKHYTETILGVVKNQSTIRTALSTNFYGGKKGMKKRIFSIMDVGKKRVGAVVVCAALLLTLGTGAIFAVNAAATTPQADTTTQQEVQLVQRSVEAGHGQFTQEEYNLLVSLQFVGYEDMSLAEFKQRVSEFGEENGDLYYTATENVIGGISADDENASFILNTLSATIEEIACSHWQSFEADFDPAFYGEATAAHNDSEVSILYGVNYSIADDKNVTVSERDLFIQSYLHSMQDFANGLSKTDWAGMSQNEIQAAVEHELVRLSDEISTDKIQITNTEFLGIA